MQVDPNREFHLPFLVLIPTANCPSEPPLERLASGLSEPLHLSDINLPTGPDTRWERLLDALANCVRACRIRFITESTISAPAFR
jgi:hypothetical protein